MPTGKLLPVSGYDPNKQKIKVSDEDFYPWLVELTGNRQKYQGWRIQISGWILTDETMEQGDFLLARHLVSCCLADSLPATIPASSDLPLPKNGNWVRLEAVLEESSYRGYPCPLLRVLQMEEIAPIEEPYIYTYDY